MNRPSLKNRLTLINFRLSVITVLNGRVVFQETIQEYLKSWFYKGFLLRLTDSSRYRGVNPSGIPLPIKEETYS